MHALLSMHQDKAEDTNISRFPTISVYSCSVQLFLHCMSWISCNIYRCLLPSSLSPFWPSAGSSHLFDILVRAVKKLESVLTGFTAAVSSCSRPVSPDLSSLFTSVGFKGISTTQIKAQHSRTSVSPFYSIWCIVHWQNSERATCLPPSQPHLMPPDGSLNFGILQEMSTECCWNDCSAKWLWFVCVAC